MSWYEPTKCFKQYELPTSTKYQLVPSSNEHQVPAGNYELPSHGSSLVAFECDGIQNFIVHHHYISWSMGKMSLDDCDIYDRAHFYFFTLIMGWKWKKSNPRNWWIQFKVSNSPFDIISGAWAWQQREKIKICVEETCLFVFVCEWELYFFFLFVICDVYTLWVYTNLVQITCGDV